MISNSIFLFYFFQLSKVRSKLGALRGMTHGSKLMVFSTAIMGAFVAGLDAGLVYNSWPKFAENWIPENMLSRSPTWKNFFENDVTVQFVHRNLAYLTVISVLSTFLIGRRAPIPKRTRMALNLTVAAVFGQAALGVFTLVCIFKFCIFSAENAVPGSDTTNLY